VQRNTLAACFLAWSLDAFDFFVLTFCLNAIATQFQARVSAVAEAIFLTLALRPVGAFLFGLMAERFGRRLTLIINIITFSIFELGSAFAPSLKAFFVMRALFGIAMGGEWGVGAALAFETLPPAGRGFFSGLLQAGYTAGYLGASLAYWMIFQFVGWRGMFVVGTLPALVVIYICTKVQESPAWLEGRVSRSSRSRPGEGIFTHIGSLVFLTVLMFAFTSLSHGTQDLYPAFLQKDHHFTPQTVGFIAAIANVGALLGGTLFGTWSEKIGRRRAIVIAALFTIPVIPLWAYSRTVHLLALGGFLMQFMVQGAWGVVPAHLNELSPPTVRGTFPGLAFQLGNLFSSCNGVIQARLAQHRFGGAFAPVLAWTVLAVASLLAMVTWIGRERKSADLSTTG
jgi:SHS family lactate transporter-like MFS transporter